MNEVDDSPVRTGKVDQVLGWLSAGLLALLTADVLAGVASRYVLGGQWRWTEELATFLLVWLVFVGGAAAYREKSHLGIDLLVTNLSPGARWATEVFGHVCILAFVVLVLLWGGTGLVLDRWQSGQQMPTLGIRRAWLYLAAPVSGLFYAGFALWNLVHLIRTRRESGREEPRP